MSIFHRHKFGKVDEKGFQYCEECGKARFIHTSCEHKWKVIESYTKYYNNDSPNTIRGLKYVQECRECGKIQTIDP